MDFGSFVGFGVQNAHLGGKIVGNCSLSSPQANDNSFMVSVLPLPRPGPALALAEAPGVKDLLLEPGISWLSL